jgi:Na+-driven multidrug efflux pump
MVRGSGDTLPLTTITFISLFVFRAGIAFSLVRLTPFKEHGVWAGMTISSYIAAFMSWIYYRTGKWKEKIKIKPLIPGGSKI